MENYDFESMNISESLKRAMNDMGYEKATPIQAKTIDAILDGRDVIGQAKTGSGKTAAFAVPCIESIDPDDNGLQAIILAPTREPAMKICAEIRKLLKYTDNIKTAAVYGGQPIIEQIKVLRKGVQIVVGTPGRVIDHIKRHTLKPQNVRYVVLDEADEMLNMGFREDMEKILKKLPKERQTLLFSATMPKAVLDITNEYQKEPVHIKAEAEKTAMPEIAQFYIEIKEKTKPEALCRMLDFYAPKLAMVFCNTKKRVDEVTDMLKTRGFKAAGLHGDMEQPKRDKVMKKFRSGAANILAATDVAARGLDIDNVELVINYDLPLEEEYYVHRVGRTGRAGKTGTALSFVTGKETNRLRAVMGYTKRKIKLMPLPSLAEITKEKIGRLVDDAQNLFDKLPEIYVETIQRLEKNNIPIDMLAAALLKMSIGDSEDDDMPNDINEGPEVRVLYIDAGSRDNVRIKDVVGAIAGECGIQGSLIGDIEVCEDYTLVEMPRKYVKDVLKGMKGKKIKKKKVTVRLTAEED